MKHRIDRDEHRRRNQCMRKWYFTYDCARRSAERRKVIAKLGINRDNFYTGFNDTRGIKQDIDKTK